MGYLLNELGLGQVFKTHDVHPSSKLLLLILLSIPLTVGVVIIVGLLMTILVVVVVVGDVWGPTPGSLIDPKLWVKVIIV